MTSPALPEDEGDRDLATSIFKVLHALVQPSSGLSTSDAAAQLNALFPQLRISYSDPSSAHVQRRAFLHEIWGGMCYIAKRLPAGSASQDRIVGLIKCLRDSDMDIVQVEAWKVVGKGTRKDRLIPRKVQRTLSLSEVIKTRSVFPDAVAQRPASEIVWPQVWLDLPGFLEDVEKVIKGNDGEYARNFAAFVERVKEEDLTNPPFI